MKRTLRILAIVLGAGILASVVAIGVQRASASRAATPAPAIANVPVLVYHELDNGCAAAAPVCDASDPESVSSAQMTAQLRWMYSEGYRTINLTQYLAWLKGNTAGLPAKPLLITYDNGIGDLLQGSVPILRSFGYSAVAFLVSGFADGAAGVCHGTPIVDHPQINTQPDCLIATRGWDLTWSQLQSLPTSVYQFALEAGPSGHFAQNYAGSCYQFYACKAPGETNAQYQARVLADQKAGIAAVTSHLRNVNTDGWVVPYSDLGYAQCGASSCTAQTSTGPAGWLQSEAASRFQAAFVEDAKQNGVLNQRFRLDVQGWMTQSEFESLVTHDVAAGSFDR